MKTPTPKQKAIIMALYNSGDQPLIEDRYLNVNMNYVRQFIDYGRYFNYIGKIMAGKIYFVKNGLPFPASETIKAQTVRSLVNRGMICLKRFHSANNFHVEFELTQDGIKMGEKLYQEAKK